MSKSRAERAAALELWADTVEAKDLKSADIAALGHIADLGTFRGPVSAG